ncbi:MAG: hypothetical protein IKQ97_03210, partial [Eubacterium sp.]|nr:hypothetical protein [Eubacterium sp.]
PYYLSVFPPASLPSLADATASTRSGALQDGENILRKWSRYLMSAALGNTVTVNKKQNVRLERNYESKKMFSDAFGIGISV